MSDKQHLTTYIKFIKAYHKVYPDNFIVLVGDEIDIGHDLGILFYR